ncbi:hypothetical protein QU487_06285 [Crenobacter sp. SG2305]|uniref:hypothetical protein n=1 Tax=Crenobacter oryzisoli TaxID=3056844 RepID=UPI0025AAD2E7|nr:hypothetical protein [Crenobacter sp. SG2305]MDN0082360.1 hypothetical protein [Crenobacter sp. SG2305]
MKKHQPLSELEIQMISDRYQVRRMIKELLPRRFHVQIVLEWDAEDEYHDTYTATETYRLDGHWLRIESAIEQLNRSYADFCTEHDLTRDSDIIISSIKVVDDLDETITKVKSGMGSGCFTWLQPLLDDAERTEASKRIKQLEEMAREESRWDNFCSARSLEGQADELKLRLSMGDYLARRNVLWPTTASVVPV